MAFEGLSSKLQDTIKKLKGKGKLSEKDIKEAMREVKLALLEADVNQEPRKNQSKYSQLICNSEAKNIQWRKDSLFSKWRWGN